MNRTSKLLLGTFILTIFNLNAQTTNYGTDSGTSGQYSSYFGTLAGNISTSLKNTFIGHNSGKVTTNGANNTFIGASTGSNNISGNRNVFTGANSGYNNIGGHSNVFSGFDAGYNNIGGHSNIFIGLRAGNDNTNGAGNTFIGANSGKQNSVGNYNTYMGFNSGLVSIGNNNVFLGAFSGDSNTNGGQNVFTGAGSGGSNTSGSQNVFIGHNSGNKNTTGNHGVFMGLESGFSNTTARYNVFLGARAGKFTSTGESNVFIGYHSGNENIAGTSNTYVGHHSGLKNKSSFNTFLGMRAGQNNIDGGNNVFVGPDAGYNSTGSGNIFIGKQAGFSEIENNKLIINNTSTNPLIYGDFATDKLGINTINPTKTLDVGGDINFTGDLYKNGVLFEAGGGGINGITELNGDIGIGTATPTTKLDVNGTVQGLVGRFNNSLPDGSTFTDVTDRNASCLVLSAGKKFGESESLFNIFDFPQSNIDSKSRAFIGLEDRNYKTRWSFSARSDGNSNLFYYDKNQTLIYDLTEDGTGNVFIKLPKPNSQLSIGTNKTFSDYKLSVAGKVQATEIKVHTGWSDFVFYKDYNLPSLKEVENFINEKGHLKNIPSAKEVAKNGIFLGDMNSKLLQKIEELTLYTIQQEKKLEVKNTEVQELKEKSQSQDQKIELLLKRLEKLEASK